MRFITFSSYDLANIIRLFEESGVKESPAEFTESEHRTYQKALAIRLAQETKHHLNLAKGPKNHCKPEFDEHSEECIKGIRKCQSFDPDATTKVEVPNV